MIWKIKNIEGFALGLVLCVALLVATYCQLPQLLNKYAINDDVRQANYILTYKDHDLFKGDVITQYFKSWNPIGVKAFYALISNIADPLSVTKILPFFLFLFSTYLIFKIGLSLGSLRMAFLSSILFIFVTWSRMRFSVFGSSNGADFGYLLFIAFIYFLIKRNFTVLASVLFLLCLFYPPLLLVCVITLLLSFREERKMKVVLDRAKIIMIVVLLIGIALMFLYKVSNNLRMVNLAEMRHMAEFYPGGRKEIFYPNFYLRWTNAESGLGIADFPMQFLIVASFMMMLVLKNKSFSIPRIFRNIFIASIVSFILATIFMYQLHGPARYFGRYSIPIVLIFYVLINLDRILTKMRHVFLSRLLFLLFFILLSFVFIFRLERRYIIAPYPKLYEFLSKLPKDAVIASHPEIADNIPIFAQRTVLINEETSTPEHLSLYPILKGRTLDFFRAYYSESEKDIKEFCKKYDISYLVVNKNHFSSDYLKRGEFYFEPFNSYIKKIVRSKNSFALITICKKMSIFKDSDICLVASKDILSNN